MPRSHIPFNQTKNRYLRRLQLAPWSGGGFQSSPVSQVPGGFFDCMDDVSFALRWEAAGPRAARRWAIWPVPCPGSEVLCGEGFLGNFLQVLVDVFRVHFAKFTGFRLILPQRKVAAAIADIHGPSVRLHFRGKNNQEHDITLRDREATNPSAPGCESSEGLLQRLAGKSRRFARPAESPETEFAAMWPCAYLLGGSQGIGLEQLRF